MAKDYTLDELKNLPHALQMVVLSQAPAELQQLALQGAVAMKGGESGHLSAVAESEASGSGRTGA